MSFAAGMGPGIGAGFAIGIGAGMAAGKRKAADDIRKYMDSHNVTIRDDHGETMLTDDFLHQALGTHAVNVKTVPVVIGVLLSILGLLGLIFVLHR
jgi:hypothetical protein